MMLNSIDRVHLSLPKLKTSAHDVLLYISGATSLDDDASPSADKPTNFSFFTIEYYQQFFDVDTNIVCERILNSVVPRRASTTYLRQNIAKNPDLYGPFWIVVTLVRQRSVDRSTWLLGSMTLNAFGTFSRIDLLHRDQRQRGQLPADGQQRLQVALQLPSSVDGGHHHCDVRVPGAGRPVGGLQVVRAAVRSGHRDGGEY